MTESIRAVGKRVIAKRAQAKEESEGGLILPDQTREEEVANLAIVVSVGSIEEKIQEGDRIHFAKYGGEPVKVNGEELLIINEKDILTVFE